MQSRFKICGVVAIIALLLHGCGGEDNDSEDGGGTGSTGAPTTGVMLGGPPNSPSIDAIKDYDADDFTLPGEISVDSDGVQVDRTNLLISFLAGTTTGEVNSMLSSVRGSIVIMSEGVNAVTVKIPDPGDLAALNALIAHIETFPIVDFVLRAEIDSPEELPNNIDPSASASLAYIDHHISVRGPAAWNAKAALSPTSSNLTLLVTDYFGFGAPNSDFDVSVLQPSEFGNKQPSDHGYYVLGILSGKHQTNSAKTSIRDVVTGIFPATIALRAIDLTDPASLSVANRFKYLSSTATFLWDKICPGANKVIGCTATHKNSNAVIINTSLGFYTATPVTTAAKSSMVAHANWWLRLIRGDPTYSAGQKGLLETSFVHLKSAGNYRNNSTNSAAWTGAYLHPINAAAMHSGFKTSQGNLVPGLSNTLVVEARENNPTTPYSPGCLDKSSNTGQISGIGVKVWSFSHDSAYEDGGTSAATPQVAGLAAYVWSLNPILTADEVVSILKNNSFDDGNPSCGNLTPETAIDAYKAVLAVDKPDVLTSGDTSKAPTRLAILNVNAMSATFAGADVTEFISEFKTRGTSVTRDYSRYDLNGDGFTGQEDKKYKFDLNMDGQYNVINQTILNAQYKFDENLVSDWDILCYYAFSPIYQDPTMTAATAFRQNLDLNKCTAASETLLVNPGNSWKPIVIFDSYTGVLTSLDLSSTPSGNNITSGTVLEVKALGAFFFNTFGGISTGAAGLFVDAVGAPIPPAAGSTALPANLPADCQSGGDPFVGDFFIPDNANVRVVVPSGATALWLSVDDCFFSDNRPTGNPTQVIITLQ